MDRRNITDLGKDFISFHDDRLVVESYVFEITEHLFLMKLAMNQPSFESNLLEKDLETHREAVLDIIKDFESTNLTLDEASHLAQLKQKIEDKLRFSSQTITTSNTQQLEVESFNRDFEGAFKDVKALSAIQLYEGGKLIEESERIVNRSALWTQLEIAVLVVLLVIIYLLIFTSKSIRSKIKQNPSLN
ncbi:MAG TPA: hypothetical protein VKX33_04800 [Cyclobacteriaceae bacterium]|nr:hypothetical protein [Cyclobacteriaceae bacterium]